MMQAISDYFARLTAAIGQGWTRFWFTPSDPATLSVIRLLTGLVVIYLHATMLPDLVPLFGSGGLLPATEIAPLDAESFSYLNYLSTPGELWTIHLIGLAVLILFTAGFWTLPTGVLSLAVLLSDIHRAPMLTARAEPVAVLVLFYLWFAPCGQTLSLQSLLRRRRQTPGQSAAASAGDALSTLATISTRLIQIHLALLVAMMGLSKLASEAWWNGSGVWWLISRPESQLIDLTWLSETPKLIDAWTHLVVLFELAFPLLIWIPLARPLVLAAAALAWTSLAILTGEIPFALMLAIASLAFVSPRIVRACCARAPATVRPAAESLARAHG